MLWLTIYWYSQAFIDYSDLVSRRMGFTPIPLAVLVLRICTKSFKVSGYTGLGILILLYLWYVPQFCCKYVSIDNRLSVDVTSEDCWRRLWYKSCIKHLGFITHGLANFLCILRRVEKGIFFISIQYNILLAYYIILYHMKQYYIVLWNNIVSITLYMVAYW